MRDSTARWPCTLRVSYWIAAASAVGLAVVLTEMGRHLETPAAPCKIVSLELAATRPEVDGILASWQEKKVGVETALKVARRSILIDFPFIVAYSIMLGGGCWWVAGVLRRRTVPGETVVRWLAWLQPVAGVLDVVENVGMREEIGSFGRRSLADWLPPVVAVSAGTKFVLVGLGMVAIIGGLFLRWWPMRLRRTRGSAAGA